jgi:hypothetical protein
MLLLKINMIPKETFSEAVKKIYYGVDIKNMPVDKVLSEYETISFKKSIVNERKSLSVNLALNTDEAATMHSYIFYFGSSPIDSLLVEEAYIRIDVGQTKDRKKIVSVDYRILFQDKQTAEFFLSNLKKTFTPLSTSYKIDKRGENEYVQFSTESESNSGLSNITFISSPSDQQKKYEVQIMPYSEFQ